MRRTAPAGAPRASVIIPTWNGRELLLHALRSLQRQAFTDFETIVVDNGSTDGTVEALRAGFPDVHIVLLPENRGFAAAVNAGIRAARGAVIVLMNNDTEATPQWLAALVAALDAHPAVGSCASKMLDHADPGCIDSAGLRLGLFASNIGEGESDGPPFSEPRHIFGACGGAAAYRARALHEVGLFDESFFAYVEDVDLAARLQLAGQRCLFVPAAVIHHHGSVTSDRIPATRFYLLMRNSITLFLRYSSPLRLLVWAPLVLGWPFVRALLDGQQQRVAWRAVRHALRRTPEIARFRREVRRNRRITPAEFAALLVSPLTRARRKPRPIHAGAGTGTAATREPPVVTAAAVAGPRAGEATR
jgi:GT2 family glycosyltransferase